RNLGVFPISFSLVDGAFAIFWMTDFLSGAEAFLALGLLDDGLGQVELLPTRRKELGNIIDGVVALARVGGLGPLGALALPVRALVLVLVGVMGRTLIVIGSASLLARSSPRARAIGSHPGAPSRTAQLFNEPCRDLIQKSGRHARFG